MFGWLSKRKQQRSGAGGWLWGAAGGGAAGVTVNAETAIGVPAVYAAVRVLAETVASLPVFLYEKTPEGGKHRVEDHPLQSLLHDAPNQWQTSFEFREMLQGHLALRGNAYCQILRNGGASPAELIPLNPTRIELEIGDNGPRAYLYRPDTGAQQRFRPDQILHLKGLSSDGYRGLSPIEAAKEAIGLAMAAEKFGSKFFSNNARPGGVLKHPGKLDETGIENLKASWQAAHTGENSQKVAILEEGMSWESIGLSNESSQFLESRKFQIEEIARLFRIPPHLIGGLERATFSNIEQQGIDFIVYSIRPWLIRWEQALNRALLSEAERGRYFFEFLVDGLLRGDTLTRYQAYNIGIQSGILTRNECRLMENRDPLPGLDQPMAPLNMAGAQAGMPGADGAPAPKAEADPASAETDPAPAAAEADPAARSNLPAAGTTETEQKPRPAAEVLQPLFEDAFGRIFRKEAKARSKKALKELDDKQFFKAHKAYQVEVLHPILRAAFSLTGKPYSERDISDHADRLADNEITISIGEYVRGPDLLDADWEKDRSITAVISALGDFE